MIRKGNKFTHFGRDIDHPPFFEGIEMLHFTDVTFGSFLLHDHDVIEIMLILDGDVGVAVKGERYELPRGCMVLIPPKLVHQTIVPEGTKRYERMVLHIFPEYVKLITKGLPATTYRFQFTDKVNIFDYSPETFWMFRTLFERAYYAITQDKEYQRLVIPSLVVELFVEMEHILLDRVTPPIPATNNLVTTGVDYIDEHFAEPGLTVEQIRESVYVSQGYLSRVFKSFTGSSVYNFLTYKRLIRAKELLVSGETVLDACLSSGFTDYTSFLKTFKKAFHMTPTQYRKKYRQMVDNRESTFGGFTLTVLEGGE